MITWSDNGLTYALASDLAVSGDRSCMVCHGSARERRQVEGLGASARRRFMRTLVLALLLLGDELPATVDPAAIPNYQLLKPGLAVAGKPSAAAVGRLKEQGFKTVIDLRSESEGLAEEKAGVLAQGLRYVSVPMTAQSFTLADALKVKGVLEDPASGPVLLHCASSNRVGAVIAVIEAKNGKSLEQAIEEGRKAGLRSDSLVEAVKRVLAEPGPRSLEPRERHELGRRRATLVGVERARELRRPRRLELRDVGAVHRLPEPLAAREDRPEPQPALLDLDHALRLDAQRAVPAARLDRPRAHEDPALDHDRPDPDHAVRLRAGADAEDLAVADRRERRAGEAGGVHLCLLSRACRRRRR